MQRRKEHRADSEKEVEVGGGIEDANEGLDSHLVLHVHHHKTQRVTQQRGKALFTVIDETVYRKDPISRFVSSDCSTSSRARPDDTSFLMLLSTKA
jgi:hypothetical protein